MVLIFGKHGQLAQSFRATVPEALESSSVFVSSQEANFEQPEKLAGYLDHLGPDVVVVCAAYTQVDKAEEEREIAELINTRAPQEIARWCQMNDKLMIYFSTDYVFDGSGSAPKREEDPKGPLNWYGSTKLAGEEAIQNTFCKHLIFRTSWVYSEYGKNFVKTMLRMGKDKTHLRIVDDQIGGPTYAPDLALAVWPLIERRLKGEKFSSGVYHMAGVGAVSWAQFAEEIFSWCRARKKEMSVEKVDGIPTAEYATPAIRPLNSRLDQSKLKAELGIEMPFWKDSLNLCLKRLEPGG